MCTAKKIKPHGLNLVLTLFDKFCFFICSVNATPCSSPRCPRPCLPHSLFSRKPVRNGRPASVSKIVQPADSSQAQQKQGVSENPAAQEYRRTNGPAQPCGLQMIRKAGKMPVMATAPAVGQPRACRLAMRRRNGIGAFCIFTAFSMTNRSENWQPHSASWLPQQQQQDTLPERTGMLCAGIPAARLFYIAHHMHGAATPTGVPGYTIRAAWTERAGFVVHLKKRMRLRILFVLSVQVLAHAVHCRTDQDPKGPRYTAVSGRSICPGCNGT